MVPNGWKLNKLEELCSPDAPITYGVLKPGDYVSNGIPLLQIKDLKNGEVLLNNLHLISPVLDEEYKRSRIRENDILISLVGTIGRVAKVKNLNSANIHRNIGRVRSDCHEYLYHFLSSDIALRKMGETSSGSSQSALNLSTLRSMKVPVPPLPEQKKIAQILSTWDTAITTTEQLLTNSRQQKKALMQQLLTGKQRLLSDTGERFSGEWKVGKLSDICTVNPKKSEAPEDGRVSFIPMDAVSEEAKIMRREERAYTEVDKGFTSFRDNDVLIAKITPCFENGKGGYAENLKNRIGFGSTEFHVLRAKNNVCSRFIYYVTNTKDFRVRGEMNMQGSAGQKRVTKDYLSLYSLKVPSCLEEQQKIAAVLSAADKEIEALQQKLAALKQEKKALMQQLLTGKRRVVVSPDAAVGANA